MKNCTLKMGDLKVGLSSEKIRFTLGAWTSIADFPAKEKVTEWESAEIVNHLNRRMISLKVWQKIEDEVSLEELHWFVFEPIKTQLHQHLDLRIGKRKLKPPLIQDVPQKTKLWVEKDRIRWSAGQQSGEIQ
jgi:hypothetical protein